MHRRSRFLIHSLPRRRSTHTSHTGRHDPRARCVRRCSHVSDILRGCGSRTPPIKSEEAADAPRRRPSPCRVASSECRHRTTRVIASGRAERGSRLGCPVMRPPRAGYTHARARLPTPPPRRSRGGPADGLLPACKRGAHRIMYARAAAARPCERAARAMGCGGGSSGRRYSRAPRQPGLSRTPRSRWQPSGCCPPAHQAEPQRGTQQWQN
jgi:hypothetical protein